MAEAGCILTGVSLGQPGGTCRADRLLLSEPISALETGRNGTCHTLPRASPSSFPEEPVRAPLMVDASTITTEAEETCEDLKIPHGIPRRSSR